MRFSFSQPLPVTKRTQSVSKARYWPSHPPSWEAGSQDTTPGSFSQQRCVASALVTPANRPLCRTHVTAAGTLNDATYCTQPSGTLALLHISTVVHTPAHADYEPQYSAQPTPQTRPPQPGPLQPLGRQPLQTIPLRQRMAALQGPTQHSQIAITPSSAHPAPRVDTTLAPRSEAVE